MLNEYFLVLSFFGVIYLVNNKYNIFFFKQGILSFLSFRNYESLKLDPTNYRTVGWRFAFASIFYLFVFLYFLRKSSKENKMEYNNINLDINDNHGLINEVDNDKTEYFLEGRL